MIENEVVDLVPSLDDRQLADLIYQLDQDISRAEADALAFEGFFGLAG